jgi:hypothetical protein
MSLRWVIVLAAGMAVAVQSQAQALPDDANAKESGSAAAVYSLTGFGSLGAAYHTQEGVTYRRDMSQSGGARAGELSVAPDSMVGAQLSADWGQQWRGALQVASRNSLARAETPEVTWAYLRYSPRENVALRVGRLGIELYMEGDSADIGYANLPVRQPITLYPRNLDGIDLEGTFPLGEGTLRAKASGGWTHGALRSGVGSYDLSGTRAVGALAEYVVHGWTVRLATGRLTTRNESTSAELQTLRTMLAATPNGAAIVSSSLMKDRAIDYVSLAMAYDQGPFRAVASYSKVASSGWSTQRTFYANMGYRLGRWTPYLSYYASRTGRETLSTGIPWGMSTATDQLNAAAELVQTGGKVNQWGVSLGGRYELTPTSALKLQFDHIRYLDPDAISDAALSAEIYSQRRKRSLDMLSFVWEFVF